MIEYMKHPSHMVIIMLSECSVSLGHPGKDASRALQQCDWLSLMQPGLALTPVQVRPEGLS